MKKGIFKTILTLCFVVPCFIILSACSLFGGGNVVASYTVTYDYNLEVPAGFDLSTIFDNYKTTETINEDVKIKNMPKLKADSDGILEGWYIKDADVKVGNYDYITTNITLVARWTKEPTMTTSGQGDNPSGQTNPALLAPGFYTINETTGAYTLSKTWEQVLEIYPVASTDSTRIAFHSANDRKSEFADGCLVIAEGITKVQAVGYLPIAQVVFPATLENYYHYELGDVYGKLDKIFVKEGNTHFETGNYDALITKDTHELVLGCKNSTIPDFVTKIGNTAFSGCKGLSSINIPSSVTSIDGFAFGYSGLTNITIPSAVTSIGNIAFQNCYSLSRVTIDSQAVYDAIENSGSCGYLVEYAWSIKVKKTITGTNAFLNANYDKTPGTEYDTYILKAGYHVRENNGAYGNFTFAASWDEIARSEDTAAGIVEAIDLGDYVRSYGKLVIPEGIVSVSGQIGDCVYYAEQIVFPSTMEEYIGDTWVLGEYKQKGFSRLNSVVVSDGNTKFATEYNALISKTADGQLDSLLFGCDNSVIPNGVKSIGAGAFSGCTGITNIKLPNSVTSIEKYAFSQCTGLKNITIPDSVTSIGSSVFFGCTGLTGTLLIPDSVTSISGEAFQGCTSLTSITIPDSVTSIGYRAFYGCTGLTNITIPDSVTSIGNSVFDGCTSLTNITIPNSVTSIGDIAFSGCKSLTNITIPNSVTSIGDGAFSGCTGLTSVAIPNSVTSIGYRAFYGCTGLTSITIPDSVTTLGAAAFQNCSSLNNIYLNADLIGTDNDGAINWYGNVGPFVDAGSESCSLVIGNNVTNLPAGLFKDSNVHQVVLGSNVRTIGSKTFSNCTNLSTITMSESLQTIDEMAFLGCSSLVRIDIPNNVTSIGSEAFYGCTSLTSITIPNSVTSIGYSAFYGCTNLSTVTIMSQQIYDAITSRNACGYLVYYANLIRISISITPNSNHPYLNSTNFDVDTVSPFYRFTKKSA